MLTAKLSKGESYAFTSQQEPTPLFGELREAEPVPWQALGPLAAPIRAISTLTQAPDAIAMQSVLTVASVATQALADVEALHGYVPLSCFAITVALSGERKSACDSLATAAIDQIDQSRVRNYNRDKRRFEADNIAFQKGKRRTSTNDFNVIENDLADPISDLPPEPPLFPAIRISDPTIEGLFRQLENGTPSVGVMTDEGGQFFGVDTA